MSIERLKKMTLIGLQKEKQTLLENLQNMGCMHLLSLRASETVRKKMTLPRAENAYKALRFIKDVSQRRKQLVRDTSFDVEQQVQQILDLKQQLRDTTDHLEFLRHRCTAIEPWGDIDFPPLEELAGLRLWFYVLPLAKIKVLGSLALPWQVVRKDHRFAYVVIIAKQEPVGNLLPVPRTHVGALSLGELRVQLADAEIQLEDLMAQRQAHTRYIYLLSIHLAEVDNMAALDYAAQQTRDDDALVAIQGWVSINELEAVETYARDSGLVCLIEDPDPSDNPPTLIEQPEQMDAGVDLALFYQVPGYQSWDPTLLLFVSFSIFFAMILADAGYGLVLLAGLFSFWRKLGGTKKGSSYRLLALSLFGCTVIYGVMVGSYFGISPPSGSVLGQLHILNLRDFDNMMRLSIAIGVMHIGIANIMAAYVNRFKLFALSKLGWISVIAGGLLLWLSEQASDWRSMGLLLLVSGIILIVLFSSERKLNKNSDYLRRIAEGLFNLKGLMNAFGDVLSYMRLFALGLASSSLAVTFNDLAKNVMETSPGLGLLAAILILVVGHLLNLGLTLMSGVVHGLRLNFIEFYNWGLSDEGIVFQKFAKKEVTL